MWACLYKTCPCLPRRGDMQPPFNHYSYDNDDDPVEFVNLLAEQDPDSITAFLTGNPFSRAPNTQGYLGINNMGTEDEFPGDASDRGSVLLDDETAIQTQDAQFLPDEQISKLTELASERSKYNLTDAQLAAEEEEARRIEEEEIQRKRETARQAAIAQGLVTSEAFNKDTVFTISGDDDDEVEEFGNHAVLNYNGKSNGSSVELSATSQNGTASRQSQEEQFSILNKPRNPRQRLFSSDINQDDYENDTETDILPPKNIKDQPPILPETHLGPPLSVSLQTEEETKLLMGRTRKSHKIRARSESDRIRAIFSKVLSPGSVTERTSLHDKKLLTMNFLRDNKHFFDYTGM
ncbi:hypothetical protein G9A89_003318 [Geosiphon pyriformis]|nr:hypothetical protein G9A89_003318 [Geosiphon pyriformis]